MPKIITILTFEGGILNCFKFKYHVSNDENSIVAKSGVGAALFFDAPESLLLIKKLFVFFLSIFSYKNFMMMESENGLNLHHFQN